MHTSLHTSYKTAVCWYTGEVLYFYYKDLWVWKQKKKVSGHCAKLPWELLLFKPIGFWVLLWISKSWFLGCSYLMKLSVRTTFPSGFYLAQYMLLKEKLRVLCYRIQPDILPDAINRFFSFHVKHTGVLSHSIWNFSRTGRYATLNWMGEKFSGPLCCLSIWNWQQLLMEII